MRRWRVVLLLALLTASCVSHGEVEPASGIAFVSERDGNPEIYHIQPDGSGLTRLTDAPKQDLDPAWAPDGRQIAFRSRRDGSSDIFVMAADGRRPRNLIEDPQDSLDDEFAPVWHPDGEILALYTDRYAISTCAAHQLALMPVTGGAENIELAPVPPGNQISFAWSPGGASLVFSAARCDGTGTQLYLWEREYDFVTPLTAGIFPAALYPAWSHDGRYIAFAAGERRDMDIYVLDTLDETLNNLTNHVARDTQPTWSPDGAQIAFVTDREGNDEIYVMDADGSNLRNLTQHPARDFSPAWSPVP